MTSTGPRDYWPEGFAEFWMLYPKHVAKIDARKAWRQVHPTEQDFAAMKIALTWQMQQPSWQNGYVPHPGTYLRGRRWEDEPFAPATCDPTLAELRQARDLRQRIGYCPHDPPCQDFATCLGVIVHEWRSKAGKTKRTGFSRVTR